MGKAIMLRTLLVLSALLISSESSSIVAEIRAVHGLYFDESMSMSFHFPSGSYYGGSKSVKGSKSTKSMKGVKGCAKHSKSHKHHHSHSGKGDGKGHSHSHSYSYTYSHKSPKHGLCEPTLAPVPSPPVAPTVSTPTPPVTSGPPSTGPDTTAPSPIDTQPPTPGTIPTSPSATTIRATDYTLTYTMDLFRIPDQDDYNGMTEVTNNFINSQMTQFFESAPTIQFRFSNTTRIGEEFNGPNVPLVVTFTTDVTFAPSTETVPTVDDIDDVLEEAFSSSGGLDEYLADLQSLPASNLFQSTTAVEYEEVGDGGEGSNGVASMSAATLGGIAAAGAGILVVIAGGVVALRRGGDDSVGHDAVKYHDAGGGVTVAGDTYAGSTYAGTSVDAESVLHSGWGNHSHFSTPSYRTHSPTESLHDGNDSDGSREESPPTSPRQLQTVALG